MPTFRRAVCERAPSPSPAVLILAAVTATADATAILDVTRLLVRRQCQRVLRHLQVGIVPVVLVRLAGGGRGVETVAGACAPAVWGGSGIVGPRKQFPPRKWDPARDRMPCFAARAPCSNPAGFAISEMGVRQNHFTAQIWGETGSLPPQSCAHQSIVSRSGWGQFCVCVGGNEGLLIVILYPRYYE